MSPIAPLSVSDAVFTTAGVIVFLLGVGVVRQSRYATVSAPSERYYLAGSDALARLCAIVAFIFLLGYVGLVLLPVQTAFWAIWQLFYLLSRFAVVWVLPALVILFSAWALVGHFLASYSHRSTRIAILCVASLLVALLLFYALQSGLS